MEYAQQTIIDFLSGNLDIVEFRRLYDEKPEIDAFLQKIESGEFEIIENWDSHRGVLLEDGENLLYMYLPDFKNLKSSPAAEQLKKMIEDLIKNS